VNALVDGVYNTMDLRVLELINLAVWNKYFYEAMSMEAMFPTEMARRNDTVGNYLREGNVVVELDRPEIVEIDPLRALTCLAHTASFNIEDLSGDECTEIKPFLDSIAVDPQSQGSVLCVGNILVATANDQVSSTNVV